MASLSEEEENYIRLSLLLKGVSPRAVRTYFDTEFPPTHLPSTLNTNYNTLDGLKKNRLINQAQWSILFPRNGAPDSQTFDVSVMICLIRNLNHVTPPINGFDSLPLPSEVTQESDLARIEWYRNTLAQHGSNAIDSANFITAWGDISKAISRLGGQPFNQECQKLKVKILDQSNKELMLEIKEAEKEMKELRQTVDSLRTEHSEVTENLSRLQDSHSSLQTEHSKVTENMLVIQEFQSTLQAEYLEMTVDFNRLHDFHSTLQTEHSEMTDNLRYLQDSHSTLLTKHSEVAELMKDPIPWNIKDIAKKTTTHI